MFWLISTQISGKRIRILEKMESGVQNPVRNDEQNFIQTVVGNKIFIEISSHKFVTAISQ